MKEYFSHDYNARNDTKLVKLFMKYKLEGIGAYWCIIEMLYEEGGYLLRTEYDRIAFELRTDLELIKNVIENFDLFEKDKNKFWSITAIDRLNKRISKSTKARESVQKRWDKYERNTNVILEQNNSNTSKVKESKNKTDFEIFNLKSLCLYSAEEIGNHLKEDMYVLQVLENDLKLSREEIYKLIDRFLKDQALNLHRSFGEISKHLQNWAKKQEKETSGKLIYPGNINKK